MDALKDPLRAQPGMSKLEYEPTDRARPVLVERDGDVTRIIVPMRGPYAPVPKWMTDLDLLALIVVPVWWACVLVVRTCLRLPNPPRAVFEVSGDRFKMELRDSLSGEVTSADWPRTAVAEARVNRYDRGLWINVPGQVKETYLTDVPRPALERLEAALGSALATASSSAPD